MSRKRTGRAAWRALAATLAAATGVLAASAGAAQANTAHAGLTAAAGYHIAAGAHAATQSGGHLALDAVSANGEFSQEIPASYGESYVASAWLSAQSGTASGELCLGAVCHQYNLTAGTQTLIQVGDLDTAGDELLFQNNVTVGSTSVADPSFVASELQSGSFEGSTPTGWVKMVPSGATVNMALYNTADGAPAAAQDGYGYLAFNSNASGGGVYQDVLVDSAAPGTSYVATAWLSAQSGTASGDLCVWGLSPNTNSLPNTDSCQPYTVTAATYTPVQVTYDNVYGTSLRFQVYPTPNGGTTDMDTASLMQTPTIDG